MVWLVLIMDQNSNFEDCLIFYTTYPKPALDSGQQSLL